MNLIIVGKKFNGEYFESDEKLHFLQLLCSPSFQRVTVFEIFDEDQKRVIIEAVRSRDTDAFYVKQYFNPFVVEVKK